MIIKFKTRRAIYSSKQLVSYLLSDKERTEHPFDGITYFQNMDYVEPETLHKSFVENFKYQNKRKGSLALMHTILAIHPKDREHVTKEMLIDLKDKYIELRGLKNAVILAKVHTSEESIHWHLMIGANEYKSPKRLRMSKAKMKVLLREFEAYHKEKYPQLEHSIVHLNKKEREKTNIVQEDKNHRNEKEYQVKRRYEKEGSGRQTQKEIVSSMVREIFNTSPSLDSLVATIQNSPDLQIYTYRGRIKGVICHRKYRFSTLGIEKEKIQKLERIQDRLQQLSLLKEVGKERGRSR